MLRVWWRIRIRSSRYFKMWFKRGEKIKNFYTSHERHLSSLALLVGFVVDNFTLQRIDLWFENLVLFSYLGVAGLGIVSVNLYESGRIRGRVVEKLMPLLPLVIQFAFGGLFSGYFIFYSRSASLAGSWIFIIFLGVLLVGNELFKTRYLRFGFQIAIFYIALFSFTIFYIPILVGSIGVWVFLLSGLVSIGLMGAFLYFIYKIIPWRVQQGAKQLVVIIGGAYIAINAMYFTNVIPPIPLSLKNAGIYHLVERIDNGYVVRQERVEWYQFYKKYKPTYHRFQNEPVYFFSSVFSPTDLDTKIVHRWAYYNEANKEWVESSNISYDIVGGRDGGYRGYSLKENIFPGRWRVDVMTPRGQLLGRYDFVIKEVSERPILEDVVQ